MNDTANQHRLSIIIPTYNRPSILPRAVKSALAACPEGAEVIVVDDRSDTANSALASMSGDPRLRIVTNEDTKGAAGARNFGVSIARGDIIIFLDDDDELIPDYPERVLAAAAHSKADFGFSAAMLVDHRLKTEHGTESNENKTLRQGILPTNAPLQRKMPSLSFGIWIRKATFLDVGSICTEQTVDEDGDLFCRLFGLGHACWFEAAPGVRIHRAYETDGRIAPQLTDSTDLLLEARCRIRTYHNNHRYFPLRSAERWFLIRRILRYAAYKGVDDVAKAFIAEITPIDWRVQGWVFWKLKRLSAARRLSRGEK